MSMEKGGKQNEETKRKISLALKGRKVSEETRRKIGLANHIALKGRKIPWFDATRHKKHTEQWKKELSERMKGNKWRLGVKDSEETKLKKRGRKLSEEHRKRISESHKGEKNYLWKGGLSKNKQYINWQKNKRNRVIKRLKIESLSHTWGEWELLKKQYGFKCPCCHKAEPEIKLTIDHIIPLSKGGSDLIENIQPLCLKCNMKKHTKVMRYDYVIRK